MKTLRLLAKSKYFYRLVVIPPFLWIPFIFFVNIELYLPFMIHCMIGVAISIVMLFALYSET